jgi:hypothetical protein
MDTMMTAKLMTAKFQLLMAGLAALGLGAVLPPPALATDDAHHPLRTNHVRADAVYPEAPHLAPKLRPDPRRSQIADGVTGGHKQGKCTAEASAHAKANDAEDSDHDLKVAEGNDCSGKAEPGATVKQKQQSE